MSTHPFASLKSAFGRSGNLSRAPRRIRGMLACLGAAGGFMTVLSSVSVAQQFTEVTTQVGLVNQAKKSWGNPIWGDINNDGFLDLIVPTHGLAVSGGPFVYLNNAGSSFTDIRATSGIKKAPELDSGDWHGFSFGDYDGDGNLDLYIAEGAKFKQGGTIKRDLLYKGHGDGTFAYVSDLAGIVTSSDRGRCGFWVDYDNDGKLDLFVKNYSGSNRLYKNNGDGTFTEVAAAAGIAGATQGKDVGSICSFADYDNDGFMDIAFSGDGTTDALYRNQGDGTFVDVSSAAGMTPASSGKGIAWGDYNNDGFVDLYIARGAIGAGPFSNTLYRNNGDGTFTDVSAEAGVAATTDTWSAVWGDYDNDGFLDLFVTSGGPGAKGVGNACFLYHNNGDGTFTDVAAAEGVQLEDNTSLHKGAAWADYDNDGFLDLIIKDGIGNERDTGAGSSGLHRLFRNNGNTNAFIKVNLQGVQSNTRGIGARVSATSTTGVSYRQNNGGGGGEYASQSSEPLHFGIGSATEAMIVVTWPSGIVDTVLSVPANSTITVVEGSSP
jgi:enediyne biosynthesis protein E4